MKFIKITLVIIAILLVVALVFGAYVWGQLQGLKDASSSNAGSGPTLDGGSSTSTESTVSGAKPITIDVSTLPESQQKILKTLGFNAQSYTITPQMMSCAEAKLGVGRMNEIAAGAAVSTFEAIQLIPCAK